MTALRPAGGRGRALLGAALLAFVVFASAKLGVDLSRLSDNVAAIWFANAIALAVMLVQPPRTWWLQAAAVGAGNLAMNLLHGDGMLLSLGFTACNVGEVVVAATLLHLLRATDILGSLRAILLFFVLGVGISTGLAATLGAFVVSHMFKAPYLTVWPTWWIGDAVGMLIVTPALVVLFRRDLNLRLTPLRTAEFGVIAAGLTAVMYLGSSSILEYSLANHIALKAVLPLVIWAAVRFGRGGAALASLLMAVTSMGTVLLDSRADATTLLDSMEAAQLRLLSMAATAILLATLLAERRSAAARLRDAIESMNESFALFDADDRLVLANSRHEQAYAQGRPLFTPGARFEDIIRGGMALGQHPAARGHEEEWIAERLHRHRNPGAAFEQHLGDGRWEKISERRTSDGGTVGVWTDITDLKRQELRLREAEARARAAEERLREAIGYLNVGFSLFDADDRLTLCNEQFKAIHGELADIIKPGITFEEILRASAAAGHIVKAKGRHEEWVAERMASHRNPQGPFEHPLTNGRWLLIDERRTSDGGIVGIRTDITRLKQQERQLREREEQLEATVAKLEFSESELQQRAMTLRELARERAGQRERAIAASRAKSDFLAMMSHEIRSPLNGIIGYTDLLLDSPLAPEQRHCARVARQCGTALMTVIDDILDFSKIEAGKLDLACEDFDLAEALQAVAAMTRVAAENKDLRLTVAIGDGVPCHIKGDEARLRQVLLNLVTNAVKFTEAGGIDIATELVTVDADRVMVRFAVHDTGIGIPLDAQGQLFEAFYQVDGGYRRKAGGTGLGLAICQRLVRLMHGEITVQSMPGMGSRFEFTAEFARGVDPNPVTVSRTRPAPAETPARILLVDDLEVNREIAVALLTQAGHSVDTAADGAEAAAAVSANDYDLVLMDVQMPVMDGFEATLRIRALPAPKRDVRIVAMTAYATRQDIDRCLAVGMNGHLAKPIERRTLLDAVASRSTTHPQAAAGQPAPECDSRPLLSETVLDDLELDIGRPELIGIARSIVTRLENGIEQIERDIAEGRLAGVEALAHKLISAVGCMGLLQLSDLFARLQDRAVTAQAGAPVDFDAVVRHIREVAAASLSLLLVRLPECRQRPLEQLASAAAQQASHFAALTAGQSRPQVGGT